MRDPLEYAETQFWFGLLKSIVVVKLRFFESGKKEKV